MHRVELKDYTYTRCLLPGPYPVPNAPCGVESNFQNRDSATSHSFLMHRVELKAGLMLFCNLLQPIYVPNAPCGVERQIGLEDKSLTVGFLMHRVELKGLSQLPNLSLITCS